MDEESIVIRPTARLILIDAAGRVLLYRHVDESIFDPADPAGAVRPRGFWVTPGGGLEVGESFEQAARRELIEETGLVSAEIGACVFNREKILRHNGRDVLFREQYFLARTATDSIDLSGLFENELATYREHRWWHPHELETTAEIFFPEELPALLGMLAESPSG